MWLWCGHLADHLRRELYFGGGGAVAFSSLSATLIQVRSFLNPAFQTAKFRHGEKTGEKCLPRSGIKFLFFFWFSSPLSLESGPMIGFSAGDLTRVPVSPGALIEIRRPTIGAFGGIFFSATKLLFLAILPPLFASISEQRVLRKMFPKNFFGGKTQKELAIERRNIFRAYPQSFFFHRDKLR